jgi:hypothetical protein
MTNVRTFSSPLLLVTLGGCSLPAPSLAAQSFWRSVGVRGGFYEPGGRYGLYQAELFAVYQFPWGLRSASGWELSTRGATTMGILTGGGDTGFITSIGPAFGLLKSGFPAEADVGVSATVLGRDTFGHRDFNGKAQFTSHGALAYRLNKTLGLEYRFQHMSNGGINGSRNPGVNLHLFGLSWYLPQ